MNDFTKYSYFTISVGAQYWEDELQQKADEGFRLVCYVGENATQYPNGAIIMERPRPGAS
jgi:hypothetical protein